MKARIDFSIHVYPRTMSKLMGIKAYLITKISFSVFLFCCVSTLFIRFVQAVERSRRPRSREMVSSLYLLHATVIGSVRFVSSVTSVRNAILYYKKHAHTLRSRTLEKINPTIYLIYVFHTLAKVTRQRRQAELSKPRINRASTGVFSS